MSLKDRINADLKDALKAKETLRVNCLRMLKARIQEREVELRAERGAKHELEDEEILPVLSAYAKQRRDSIESFRRGGREDLATKEEAELDVIAGYLPRQLPPEEIGRIVQEAITETGAASARDLGKVMKLVMGRVKGAADGKLVNRIVREKLGSQRSSSSTLSSDR
jgi:uncharacterized protein YqeY